MSYLKNDKDVAGKGKLHFTPCRTLGLSRKWKATPPTCNISSIISPVTSLVEPQNDTPPSSKTWEKPDESLQKSTRSKINIESRFKSEEKPFKNAVANKPQKVVKKSTRNKEETKTLQPISCPVATNNNNKTDTVIIESSKIEDTKIKLNSKAVKNVLENKENKPKRSLNRCLSMKKSSAYTPEELSDVEDLITTHKTSSTSLVSMEEFSKDCSVDLVRISDDEKIGDCPPKATAKKRRMIVYSSDEDDFVFSQNSTKSNGAGDAKWDEKIMQVKMEIKRKELELSDLKQAQIYKKLHDVGELRETTNLWKEGCRDALNHLLNKLQEHGPIDMLMLLKNLNISNIISYDEKMDQLFFK